MTMETVIKGAGIVFNMSGRPLFKGLDIAIRSREFMVIGGVNGAGKTTLLRLLSGELRPVDGRVEWVGGWKGVKGMARERAYLAQQTTCTLPFRALEVVLFGAEAAGLRGAAALELARRSMARTRTSHLEGCSMARLSGGEAQRVHWARVLAQMGGVAVERKVLFLDEPISSLDVAHQHELLALAREEARGGVAVVAVLHDLNLAAEYADRLVFLHEGRLFADGAAEEVLTPELMRRVYGVEAEVTENPWTGRPSLFIGSPRGAQPNGDLPAAGRGAMLSSL